MAAPNPQAAAAVAGLRELLDIILLVHPVKKKGSGLAIPFSFEKEIDGLEYIGKHRDTGKDVVLPDQLITWINFKKSVHALQGKQFPPTKDEFYQWLTEGKNLKVKPEKLKQKLDDRWEKIRKILVMLDSLDKRLQETKIGYLEVRDVTANDEKKIFEIINTGGTPLTSEEILSAKPAFNTKVDKPDSSIEVNVSSLYKEIGVTNQEVVRWDVAATLVDRIDLPMIFRVKP